MKRMIDVGCEAYPQIQQGISVSDVDGARLGGLWSTSGMTLLDYFAGIAMRAVLDATPTYSDWNAKDDSDMAKNSYRIAAAMIAEKRRLEGEK